MNNMYDDITLSDQYMAKEFKIYLLLKTSLVLVHLVTITWHYL